MRERLDAVEVGCRSVVFLAYTSLSEQRQVIATVVLYSKLNTPAMSAAAAGDAEMLQPQVAEQTKSTMICECSAQQLWRNAALTGSVLYFAILLPLRCCGFNYNTDHTTHCIPVHLGMLAVFRVLEH